MAPGLAIPAPPPTSAATLEVWWGAMNGGRVISGVSGDSVPATEWIAVTSSASLSDSGGSSPGSRWASIVFPIPGGLICTNLSTSPADLHLTHDLFRTRTLKVTDSGTPARVRLMR
jgi:hypothetical protein